MLDKDSEDKIMHISGALETLLAYGTTQFFPGRAEYDIKQPIQICVRVIHQFLLKLYPMQRELLIDKIIENLTKLKTIPSKL